MKKQTSSKSVNSILSEILEFLHKKKTYVTALSCIVVFITTYALILPAITLDEQEAARQGGIDVPVQTEEIQQPVPAYQTGSISCSGKDYEVSADCDGAGLPEGTELAAKEISKSDDSYDALYDDALKAVQKDSGDQVYDFAFAQFYDISLTSEGKSVEPDGSVDVTITFDKALKANDADKVCVVHFVKNKKTGKTKPVVLGQKQVGASVKEGKLKETTFEAESFSVYAVVYTAEYEYMTADGKTYQFTVQYDSESGIPEDAELNVKELKAGSDEYDSYLNKAAKELGVEKDDVPFARFFDVEFVKDGEKIEPSSTVSVKITLKDAPEGSEQQLRVVHFEKAGPVIMDSDNSLEGKTGAAKLAFDTDSFSVYGVIVAPNPTGVNDLGGRSFTMQHNGQYVTSQVTNNGSTDLFVKSTNADDAAVWVFEETDQPGQYNIFTYVSGEKKYMQLNRRDANRAHAALDDEPQAFTVSQDNGSYVFSATDNGVTYYLNEFSNSTGFGGWYQRSGNDDRFTLNFTQPTISNDESYVTLVKYNDKYYIVNNDATLTEVDYYEATQTVRMDEPMEWKVEQNGSNGHIWYNNKETGFTNDQRARDFLRMYLDPKSDTALSEEIGKSNENGGPIEGQNVEVIHDNWYNYGTPDQYEEAHVGNRNQMLTDTAVNIAHVSGSVYTISHGNDYLGIAFDEQTGEPLKLVGGQSSDHAAEFVFVKPNVNNADWTNHTVNHIDISIAGTASVDIPLAYGNYYGPDGQNGDPIKVVLSNTKLLLDESSLVDPDQIRITTDDLKRAVITAARADTGEEIDNAFYITGYSGNAATTLSNDQVRIEGSFLVADLAGTEYETVDSGRYNSWWGGDYVNAVHAARLANKVEYTVTVVKPLTYNLIDPEVGQLYDEEGNPIQVTVDVAFSASFNYWDDENSSNGGNECPPLRESQYGYESTWRQGGIPTHNGSGMDFVLGGDAESPDSPLVALEITKTITDEAGNTIQLKVPVTTSFDIYEKKTTAYSGSPENDPSNAVTGLHVVDNNNHPEWTEDERDATIRNGYEYWKTKNIKVDQSGSALIFDFNASDAMYYIVEKHDEASLPRTIQDKDGNEWHYVKTYMETEYVRRDEAPFSHDEYSNKTSHPGAMHVTQDYSSESDSYASIPEVAGNFRMLNGNAKKEGFLEFFVYNVYRKGVELDVEKTWADGLNVPGGTEVTVELYYAKRKIADSSGPLAEEDIADFPAKEEYALAKTEALFGNGFKKELSLNADCNWKGTFEELPHKVTDSDGNVYEVDYYAKETKIMMNGADVTAHYKAEVNKTEPEDALLSDGKVTIHNDAETVNVSVQKIWNPEPTSGSVTMKLRRYKDEDPIPNAIPTVTKVWDDDGDRDGVRPESLTVTFSNGKTSQNVTLNDANSWTAVLDEVPIAENDQPISYSWTEPSNISGYTSDAVAYNGTHAIFTNRHTPETVDVTFTVNWNDEGNADGIRPEYVTATLSDGVQYKITGDPTAESWTRTVTVPKNEQGQPITYTWTAKPSAPDGYTLTGEEANSVTFYHEPAPRYYTLNVEAIGKGGHTSTTIPQNVRYLRGTVVTLTIRKNKDWDGDTYTVTGGPNGPVSFNGTYGSTTITLTMDRDYNLQIDSNRTYGDGTWYDDWLDYTLSPEPNGTRALQSRGLMKSSGVRTAAEQKGKNRAAEHTNAQPSEAPEGYVLDEDFEVEMTLDGSGGWTKAFPDAYPKTDLLGRPYYYFVEEVSSTLPDGYWIDSYIGGPLNQDGTIRVTNKYEATGTLEFSAAKLFKNGTLGEEHQFTFRLTQVTGNESTTQATSHVILASPETKTTTATSGDSDTVTFTPISLSKVDNVDQTGEYWFLLEEIVPEDVDADGVKDGIKYDTTKKWIKVTVTDNGDGTLNIAKAGADSNGAGGTWTNEQLTSVTAHKAWLDIDGGLLSEAPDGASVEFTLYANGQPTQHKVTLDGTVDENGETEAWTASFPDLPKTTPDGTAIEYTVVETQGFAEFKQVQVTTDGGTTTITDRDAPVADDGTIYNQKIRIIRAHKYWKNQNGNLIDPPADGTATITLYKLTQGDTSVNKTQVGDPVVLDGTTDENGEEEAWIATFRNLEADADYIVEEPGLSDGFELVDISMEIEPGTTTKDFWVKTNELTEGQFLIVGDPYAFQSDDVQGGMINSLITPNDRFKWVIKKRETADGFDLYNNDGTLKRLNAYDGWTYENRVMKAFRTNANAYYYLDLSRETTVPQPLGNTSGKPVDLYKKVTVPASGDYTFKVTNQQKKTDLGSLEITKKVFLGDAPNTNAPETTYTFGIFSAPYQQGDEPVRTVELTVTGQEGSTTVLNLEYGDYVVYELDDQGNPITGANGTIGEKYYKVEYTSNPATVSDDSTPSVQVKNTEEITSLSGTKIWDILGTSLPDDPTLLLMRKSAKTGASEETVVDGEGQPLQPIWTDVAGEQDQRQFVYENLPKYDAEGYEYTYTVSEAQFTVDNKTYTVTKENNTYVVRLGGEVVSTFEVSQNAQNNITNTEKKEFSFTKEWHGTEPGTVTWPQDEHGDDIPITVTITGKKAGAADIVITKTLTSQTPPAGSGYTVYRDEYNGYVFTFTGLDSEYEYQVSESDVDGYHTEYYLKDSSDPQLSGIEWTDNGGTIKNILTTVELPESGGPGTTWIYLLGSILLLGCGILLAARRRTQRNE